MSVLSTCMSVYHSHAVPAEARRGHQNSWNWSHRRLWALWVLEMEFQASGRGTSVLNCTVFCFFPSPKALTILAPTQTLAPCLTSAPSMLASTMISEMELLQSSVATLELPQKPPSCFPRTNITTLPQQLPLLPGKVQHQKFKTLNKAYPARHARVTTVHSQAQLLLPLLAFPSTGDCSSSHTNLLLHACLT